MHISIVSPVYKADKIVDELVKRIILSVSQITDDFEIVLIDDGSPDGSWEAIERNCKRDKRVKGIKLSRNFGQFHAITCGIDYCVGDWVVVMDCDLQDRPEEILRLYKKAMEGHEIVLARRGLRKDSLIRRITSKIFFKVFNYLSGMNYDEQVSGFRIFSRKVADAFSRMKEQHRFFNGLMEWMGFEAASIDVEHGERFCGKSSYTFWKLFELSLDTITSHSNKPLKMSILVGLAMSFFAFMYGSIVLFKVLIFGSPVIGWSSLIVSMYFLCGIIITFLGIMGIYLGKTYSEVKNRPLYIISKTCNEQVTKSADNKVISYK